MKHSIQLYIVSIGKVQGLEEMNDTCRKTVHMGAINKAFIIPYF